MTAFMTSLLGIPCLTTEIRQDDVVIYTYNEAFSQIVPNGNAVFAECARLAAEQEIELLPVAIKANCSQQLEMMRAITRLCQDNHIPLPALAFTAESDYEQDLDWETVFAVPLALAKPTVSQSQKSLHAAKLQHFPDLVTEILQHPSNKYSYQLYHELLEMAVIENNINDVTDLLSNTILKRHHVYYQEIAFNTALKEGHVELVNQLALELLAGKHLNIIMAGLVIALESGNLTLIDNLLTHPEVCQQIANYAGALLLAVCRGGHVAALEALIAIPEFNLELDWNENNALFLACSNRHIELAEKLLTYPRVKSAVTNDRNRFFMHVCGLGEIELVKELLKIPSIAEKITAVDNSALKGACATGHLDVVNELLAHSAVMNEVATWCSDILQIACFSGNLELVKKLFSIKEVKEITTAESLVITEFYEDSHVEIVPYLLTVIDVSEAFQHSILHQACQHGYVEMVRTLLAIESFKKALINNPEKIFADACEKKQLAVVRELLAVLGRQNTAWNSKAMRVACANNDIQLLRELLALPGVKEQAVALDNQALTVAYHAGYVEVVDELLAIPEVSRSMNPSEIRLVAACKNGKLARLKKLLAIPEVKAIVANNRNQAFREACFQGHSLLAAELLKITEVQKKAAINGNQALFRACLNGNHEVVRLLMTVPAIRKASASPESCILTVAAEKGNINVLCELLQQPEIKALSHKQFNEALKGAIREQGCQAVHELLQYPQVIIALKHDRNTILDTAIDTQNSEILQRLLKEKNIIEKMSITQLIDILSMLNISLPELDLTELFKQACLGQVELLELIERISDTDQAGLSAFRQYLIYYGYEVVTEDISGENLRNALIESIQNSFKHAFQSPQIHAGLILQIRADVAHLNRLKNTYTALSGNTESAMETSLVNEAVNRFKNKVKLDFTEQFTSMGGIVQIESAIYAALLERKITKLLQQSTMDSIAQITFIQQNKAALIQREETVLAVVRGYFTSTTDTLDIALRALDPKAPTHGWEKLFIAPSKEKETNMSFSTRASHASELTLKQASDICREMLCYAFLVTQDATLHENERHELFTVFIMYLAEISRAHNMDSLETDNPSCFPGTLSRLDLIFQRHPKYHVDISVFKAINEIASQLITKAFTQELRLLTDPAKKLALYEAIVLFDHTNALAILHPCRKNKVRLISGESANLDDLLHLRAAFFEKYFGAEGGQGILKIAEIIAERHQLTLSPEIEVVAKLPLLNMSKATPTTTFSLTEAYQRACPMAVMSQQRDNPFKADYEKLFALYAMLPEPRRKQMAQTQFIELNIKAAYFSAFITAKTEEIEEQFQSIKAQITDEHSNLAKTDWLFYELIIGKLCENLQCKRKLFPTKERIQQAIVTAESQSITEEMDYLEKTPSPIIHSRQPSVSQSHMMIVGTDPKNEMSDTKKMDLSI